ncbi:ATP-dependent DNA helicase, partial [candidate division WOR-3 bacterium]|nr:ATP-dependent DNA helicase [candidate division WOR-3 bacterium]
NIVSGKRVLPKYDAVVFDEAQDIEEVATLYFGIHISNYTIDFFLNTIEREIRDRDLSRAITDARGAKKDFFKRVLETVGDEKVRRIREKGVVSNSISPKLDAISRVLKSLRKSAEDEEEVEELGRYIARCKFLDVELGEFLNQSVEDSVYWMEVARRASRSGDISRSRASRVSINTAPIIVAPWMEQYVFDSDIPIVLTSATLTVDKSFNFFADRIGLQDREELLLSTSFDYKRNAILYIPRDGTDPRNKDYSKFVASEIKKLVQITPQSSGILVLFTSFRLMNEVYELVICKGGIETRHYLKQGEASRDELLERFKKTPSILFGVQSFWQGVDVPGEALSMVIITRLPFEVPDSPITEARAEWIAENKGNPFMEYQLPQAVIQLKQGFGRLIRRCTDRGVVAILDTRIRKKYYGRKFLASLPECEITYDIEKVRCFLSKSD